MDDTGPSTLQNDLGGLNISGGFSFAGNWMNQPTFNVAQSATPSLSRIWTVPKHSSKHFVGREDVLKDLHLAFTEDSSPGPAQRKTAVIHGLGGAGKSEICLKYAEAHREQYGFST